MKQPSLKPFSFITDFNKRTITFPYQQVVSLMEDFAQTNMFDKYVTGFAKTDRIVTTAEIQLNV